MNDDSANLNHQGGDGDILKKSKKKKRKSFDSVACEDSPNVDDTPIGEVGISESLSKVKKSKKKRKSRHDEEPAVQPEVVVDVISDPTKSRKKRKLPHEGDTAVQTEEADEILPEASSKIKKKRKVLLEDPAQSEQCLEVQEEPGEDAVIKKKKKKRKSAKHVEEDFRSGVEVNEELMNLPHKKNKKQKSDQDSSMEEHGVCKVEKDPDDNTLHKKKKKKRKLASEGQDVDVLITESSQRISTSAIDASIDDSAAVKASEKIMKRKHRCKDTDILSENPSICPTNSSQRAKIKQDYQVVINPYVWTRPGLERPNTARPSTARPSRAPPKRFQPKYQTISPQNVEGWQSMDFKFDNHPMVRHYIPRKLMAMNGIKQQLGEMDKVHLKIPNILFHGSSLYDIPGYGYGMPD